MRSGIDIPFARFLMLLSLVLLGVLEYLWLHNEFRNKYRDMEDRINQVLFTNLRDVEDSLIYARLATTGPFTMTREHEELTVNILVDEKDSVQRTEICPHDRPIKFKTIDSKPRNSMRGMLLKGMVVDSALRDTSRINMSSMVMHHIRMSDSTGEFAGYDIITWQGGDTMLSGLVSKPQPDLLAGKKMALSNENYRAEIFHDLIPHISFAVFLWLMVGAAFYYIFINLRKQIQLNALRDEFVSNITHELKTPITTVGVALESLNYAQDLQTMQSRRYLDICRGELTRLSMLVERILTNRSPQLRCEVFDLKELAEEVMHHMKVQFDKRNAIVTLDHTGEGFLIEGDKAHLSGVLFNLIENALKYTRIEPEIRIRIFRENGFVHLEVTDNGIGIDAGYHDKIFEKLFRVPTKDRHDVKGHGLGLSYVADVVKQHKGQIGLRSVPGSGSTFILTLPACSTSVSGEVPEKPLFNQRLN